MKQLVGILIWKAGYQLNVAFRILKYPKFTWFFGGIQWYGLLVTHIPPKIQGWRVFFFWFRPGEHRKPMPQETVLRTSCSFKKSCLHVETDACLKCFFWGNQNGSKLQTLTAICTVLTPPTSPKWIKAASTCQMCSCRFVERGGFKLLSHCTGKLNENRNNYTQCKSPILSGDAKFNMYLFQWRWLE